MPVPDITLLETANLTVLEELNPEEIGAPTEIVETLVGQGPPGPGGVVSVVAGASVTVDSTDPANPIVNATAQVANDLTASTTIAPSKSAVNTALAAKLDASEYHKFYKGSYTSLGLLQAAWTSANAVAGDYATVDVGSGTPLVRYSWDVDEGWVLGTGIVAATTSEVVEGGNLYHTSARVRAVILTGLSVATSQVVAATDTVLQAIGYLQAQITSLTTSKQDADQPAVTVSMASVDMTASAATAAASTLNLTNTGDGTKTLTFTASETLRGKRTIRNSGTSAVHITSAETYSVSIPAGKIVDLVYIYGTGFLYADRFRDIGTTFTAGTTNGALTTEQIFAQLPLPYNSLQNDGDTVVMQLMADKSGVASTQTLRFRVGTAGTTADIAVWVASPMAGANDAVYTEVYLTRVNATTIMLTSLAGWYVPFNTSQANYVTYTVPNLNTANSIVSVSTHYSSGGGTETITNHRFNLSVR